MNAVVETEAPPSLLNLARVHGDYWAIKGEHARGAVAYLQDTEYEAHMAAYQARVGTPTSTQGAVRPEERPYKITGGAALIPMEGVMTRKPTSYGGCSYILTQHAVRVAGRDPDVKSIVLLVSSPGGSVNGLQELTDEIERVAAIKPITSYIPDGAFSAAYYAITPTRIVIERTAQCGSLGTMSIIVDSSEAAKAAGRFVEVVSTGELKGQGTEGYPINDAYRAMIRGFVEDYGDLFKAAIARGRKLSEKQIAAVFTGGYFMAADALKLGLVDALGTLDDVMTELVETTVTVDEDPDEEFESTAPTGGEDTPPERPWSALNGDTLGANGEPVYGRGTKPTRDWIPRLFRGASADNTISASQGGESRPRAGKDEPPVAQTTEPPIPMDNFKNRLADACRASGFGEIAAALDTSTREDPESVSRIVAENLKVEIAKGLAADPLLRAVKACGIETPEGMGAFAATQKIGASHFADLRERTQAQAIRAYGEEKGPKMVAGLAHMSYQSVADMHEMFKAQADEQFGIADNKKGERRSASGGVVPTGVDASQVSERPFDKLPADMQAKVKAEAPTDEKRQDKLAADFLGMVPA